MLSKAQRNLLVAKRRQVLVIVIVRVVVLIVCDSLQSIPTDA